MGVAKIWSPSGPTTLGGWGGNRPWNS